MNEQNILISVVSPAFNEEENIEEIIKYWDKILKESSIEGEIVVVDDGSTDRTPFILSKLKDEVKNLIIVTHEKNLGYGKALSNAIKHSRGKYVVSIDSDGQFDLKEYPVLFERMREDNYDLVTGYRYKKKDTLFRAFANSGLNFIVKIIMGVSFKDANCAFKLYKGDVIRKIHIDSRGISTPTEILVKAKNLGYKVGEAGINHFERKGGESKLKPAKAIYQIALFLLYLKFKIYLFRAKIINSI